MTTRRTLITAAVLPLLAAGPGAAHAQTPATAAWPTRAVTLVVPFPPGGSTDMIARTLAARLQERLGATFVVDNKAGAGGTLGAAQVRRAAPDGQTLLVASLGPFVIGPHLIRNPGYDPLKDFDYVTVAVQAPNVLAVPVTSPWRTLGDLLGALKAQPGKLTFASAGNGTSDHLTAELFWQETGTQAIHVPYKGGAPAMTDLMAGVVDASFMNVNTALPQIRGGKLRALAITSAKRSPLLPELPTLEEAGLRHTTVYSWQAVAAPRGLPADVRSRLREAVVATLGEPAVRDKLLALGFEIVGNTPEQFSAFQAADHARWKKLIESRAITAD